MFRAPLSVVTLLLACSSSPSDAGKTDAGKATAKAEPSKPAKAEPAKAEPAKAEPAKAEPAKAEPAKAEPAKAEPAKAEPAAAPGGLAAIIDGLVDHSTVAYAPKDGALAYTISGSVEGTGQLLTITIRTSDGKTKDLELCEGDPDCLVTVSKRRADIEAHLKDREWVTLRAIAWPEGAAKLEDGGMSFEWKGGKLTGKRKDGSAIAFPKIPHDKPHKPSPTSIHVSDEHPVVAASFVFDPGEAYGEGFNVFTDTFVADAPK